MGHQLVHGDAEQGGGPLLRTANVNLDDYAPLDQITPSTTEKDLNTELLLERLEKAARRGMVRNTTSACCTQRAEV